jgi:hypothetical protein
MRATLLAAVLASSSLPAQDGIDWQTDFAAARALARAQDKPLLVLFRCER